nr:polyprotein [Bat picornavirus BtSY6]
MAEIFETIAQTIEPATEVVEDVTQTITGALAQVTASQATMPVGFEASSDPVGINSGIDPTLYARVFSKPTLLAWTILQSSHSPFTRLTSFNLTAKLMGDGQPFRQVGKMWKYYRADYEITLQCNAAAGAVGAALLVFFPAGTWDQYSKLSLASMFNFPHAILNVGHQTSTTLKVPFLSHYTYYTTDPEARDPQVPTPQIGVYCLRKYGYTNGMLTDLELNVFCTMKNLSFSCPNFSYQGPMKAPPNINEKSRSTRFKFVEPERVVLESDGTANLANRLCTGSNHSSALVGERIYLSSSTISKIPHVEDLLEIAKIPAMAINYETLDWKAESLFEWRSSHNSGDAVVKFNFEPTELGNLGFIGRSYVGFSGSINMEVMLFSSKLHQGRLAVIVQHEPGESSETFTREKMARLNYHVLDLSAGASMVVKIPFMYPSWMRRFDRNNYIRVQIMVLTKLCASGVAVNNIGGMLRFSAGDDFRYHFLTEDDLTVQGPTSWGSEMDLLDPIGDKEEVQEAASVPRQEEAPQPPVPETFGYRPSAYKMSAVSYTQLSNVLGRGMFITDHRYDASTSSVKIDLHIPKKGHGTLMHCFAYWAGELNVTISNDSPNNIVAAHSYREMPGRIEGAGVFVVPSRRVVTFTSPFYSETPLRPLRWGNQPTFGYLYVNPGYEQGSLKVWISIRNPKFFIPTPFHKVASVRQYLEEIDLHNPTAAEARWNVARFRKGIDKVRISRHAQPEGVQYVKEALRDKHEDVTLSGDVELNPGPTYEQVYRHRGLYKHYGVECGGKVYHLNTEDIMWSAVTGKAKIRCDPMDGSWVRTGIFGFNPQEPLVGQEMKFSLFSNCETFADDFLGYKGWSQEEIVMSLGGFLMGASFLSYVNVRDQNVEGVFSHLSEFITNTMTNTVVSRVLKFLLRMVLYSVLFAHAPCLTTGASVVALLTMDLMNLQAGNNVPWVKGFFKAAMAGDVADMVENIAHGIEDEGEQEQSVSSSVQFCKEVTNQGFFDDFNKATLSFKNVEWWYKIIVELYEKIKEKFKPTEAARFAKTASKLQDHLASLLTTVNQLKETSRDTRVASTQEYRTLYTHVHGLVSHWLEGFATFAPKHELHQTMATAMRVLQGITLPPLGPTSVARTEPVGVMVRGDPGTGKSFFTTLLSKLVRDRMGWLPSEVYTHPTGSNYMDGYSGQKIHLFDDLGQAADDEEFKLICQMISTTQFIVPMAHLDDKGTYYNSQLVLATTNRDGFSTKTINTPEALARRFPYEYNIRPKKQYSYQGRLDVKVAMSAMKVGKAWETTDGDPIDVSEIADIIAKDLKARIDTVDEWDNFVNQAPLDFDAWKAKILLEASKIDEELFGVEGPRLLDPAQKFGLRVKLACEKFGDFLKKNIHWITFLSALTGVIAVIAYFVQKRFSKQEEKEQVYQGNPTLVKKKTNFVKKEPQVTDQGPLDDKMHLRKCLVRLVADRVQVFGVSIGGTKILTYGHARDLLFKAGEVYVVYGDKMELLVEPTFQPIIVDDKETDLAIVDTKLGFSMVDGSRHFTGEVEREGLLIWNTKDGLYSQEVKDIRPLGPAMTLSGTYSHEAYAYTAQTTYGTCGGMLLVKKAGIWKMLGMHIAGNGMVGRAVALPLVNQGVYHPMEPIGLPPVNMPKKSRLRPSPVHGVYPVEKGPGALTKNDPRIEGGADPYDQIKVKNVGNVFQLKDVDRFREAWQNVRDRLSFSIGVHEPIDIDAAAFDLANPLDMSSSPGFKYTSQGFRKKDLVDLTERKIHPLLREDTEHMVRMAEDRQPYNYFTTAFKDELRTEAKIKSATTRVIEASNLDYVLAFRMLFGPQQDLICKLPALDTGIAMGINPYKDWDELIRGLWDYNYCFDYTKFDGSLSEFLMGYAGLVMESLTTQPDQLSNLLAATIWSWHHGPKEDYYLQGTNPSGTPFTTVLNCICNLIIVEYFMLDKGQYVAVTYGDDLVLSCQERVDPRDFQKILKEEFGMNITPERKEDTDFRELRPMEVSFLKRTPRFLTHTTIVGVLDVENMKQCIMWCRGEAAFKQQLNSFILELALHGRETYEQIMVDFMQVGTRLPSYDAARREVDKVVYG